MGRPPSTLSRITFRLPDALYEKLMDAAKVGAGSLNAEIVARLEASFADLPPLTPEQEALYTDAAQRHMQALERRLQDKWNELEAARASGAALEQEMRDRLAALERAYGDLFPERRDEAVDLMRQVDEERGRG